MTNVQKREFNEAPTLDTFIEWLMAIREEVGGQVKVVRFDAYEDAPGAEPPETDTCKHGKLVII